MKSTPRWFEHVRRKRKKLNSMENDVHSDRGQKNQQENLQEVGETK